MIPAFANPDAGTAARCIDALAADPRFELRTIPPEGIGAALAALVPDASRVLVAGGDGTVAQAAEVLAGTGAELAIVPAGTLNHFARDMRIPADPLEALDLAVHGESRGMDVGYLNDRLFLNTSSVGAYVVLARYRDRYRPRLGYHVALAVSALLVLLRLRSFRPRLEIEGGTRTYHTPLVFVGVGRRDMSLSRFGRRTSSAERGLHVIVVKGKGRRRLLAIALASMVRGFWTIARTPRVDSALVDECRLHPEEELVRVALDGEIVSLEAPLHYRLGAGMLRVVVP